MLRASLSWGIPSLFLSGQVPVALANRDAAWGLIRKPYDPEAVVAVAAYVDDLRRGRRPDHIPPQLEAGMKAISAMSARRRVLLLLSSALSALAMRPARVALGSVAAPEDRLRNLLQATFSDLEAARAIGRRYLVACPDAAMEALRLRDQLTAVGPSDTAGLRQILARRRDEDACKRKLVLVDGWILPRTEAQVCALTVLL